MRTNLENAAELIAADIRNLNDIEKNLFRFFVPNE